jgi:hypothetical protein
MSGIGTSGIERAQGEYALRILPLRAAEPRTFRQFHGERERASPHGCEVRKNTDDGDTSRFETPAPQFSRAPRPG